MAVQPNVLSPSITSLNATPAVRKSAGVGASQWLRTIDDTAPAFTTAGTAGGIARICRVPSNCIVKEVYWKTDVTVTTSTNDVGVYYSNAYDGTTPTNVAAADTAIDADFFGSAIDMKTASTTGWTPCSMESGTYTGAKMRQPLWQAVGLSSDPGGYLDICLTNTATVDGAPVHSLRVDYVMGA